MKAVFWDLDDTVLNTLPGRMRSLKHAYQATVGGWVDPLELWRSHRGHSLEAMGSRLLGPDGQRFVHAYREHYWNEPKPIHVYEGVRDVLESCMAEGLLLAIVTSKAAWGAVQELEQADMLRYFRAVVGEEDTEEKKPDPAPIYEAMARLLVDDPGDILFVGDSPADIHAARNAGCVPVAATWGSIDLELLLDASPTYVARTPNGVLGAIRSLTNGGPA